MGGGASAPRQPLESLSADNLRELVEGLGPKYADIAKQLQENGYDGEVLADASDEDLDELFAELSVSKLQQKVLRKKLVGLKEGISTASLDERPADGPPAAAAPEEEDYVVDAYDCFLSHKRSDCQDLVARVHDRLTDAGYRAFIDREELEELPKLKASVRASGKLVFFMSPKIFESDWCMLELCTAVDSGIEVLPVTVEGTTWGNGARVFPDVQLDVPEKVEIQGQLYEPRAAAAKAFAHAIGLEHSRSYFDAFIDKLSKRLGPAKRADGPQGSVAVGAAPSWGDVLKTLRETSGAADAVDASRPVLARALGLVDGADESSKVNVAALAALFPAGSDLAPVLRALAARAGPAVATTDGGAGEETLTPVVMAEDAATLEEAEAAGTELPDAGLALVGGNTSMASVRAQLLEALEEAGDDEGLGDTIERLKGGKFSFLLPMKGKKRRRVVMRAQEKLVRGAAAMGDPIALMPTTKAAAEPLAVTAVAVDGAADAAAEIVSRAARKDADRLNIDGALRDPALFNALRRILHEERAGKGDAPEEEAAVLASKVAELKKLLAGGGEGGTLAADVRALSAAAAAQDGTVARLAGAAVAQSVASAAADGGGDAAALVAALEPLAAAARKGLAPSLERLRAEIARDGATPSVPKSLAGGTRKRVVVVGGGFCGAMVAYKLDKIPELHVTLVDTKEYVENTPAVPRLMTLAGEEFKEMFDQSHLNHTAYVKNGDVVIGSLAAVRTDHILYGAKTGVAAHALPYDYLVISTGTSYQSDIKTDGTSIEHRRRSYEIEHERIKSAPGTVIVGGGLVGTELALDIATYFPGKKVEWLSGSDTLMSRIHGFHELTMEVVEREAAKGDLKLSLGERAISVDQAGSILTDKGNETTPGARAYWCTGYRANNGFMKDPRTAASVASCLDDEGFINAGPTHQLPALSNVFAGGDICCRDRFGGGERMAAYTHVHAMVICENIERLVGTLDGPLQAARIGIAKKGEDGAASTDNEGVLISLGKTDTLIYHRNPIARGFFPNPEEMEAKFGPIDEAPNGWLELGDLSWIKFGMGVDLMADTFRDGKDEWWAQFDGGRMYDFVP